MAPTIGLPVVWTLTRSRAAVGLAARRRRRALFTLIALTGLLLLACGSSPAQNAVHVTRLADDIGPVTANFIERAIDRAEEHEAAVWILELDTPGGLITATDRIVQRIEAATIPIVVYVGPAGARAASAGTFITMSAHVAAMAPSTQIGAAHPVAGGGDDIEGALGEKITNDAAADIRAIAQLRGRNQDWAERAVRESISATALEALDLNVIDLIATNLDDLIAQLDGREVDLTQNGPRVVIATAGAPIVETKMNVFENVLDLIVDPNIAFLLISLGGLALLIELITPGLVGPGVFGVIMLILGFFSLDALDTNPAGIALIVIAFVLFAAEFFVAGFGFLGIGGIAALLVGGLILISDQPNVEQVSLWIVIVIGAVVGAVLLGLSLLILSDRKLSRTTTVAEHMLDAQGHAQTALDPRGTALVASELWTARSDGETIPAGAAVRVVGVEGLCLVVQPLSDAEAAQPDARERRCQRARP